MKATVIKVKMKPKKSMGEMVSQADNDIISELIGNCESKMAGRFKKASPKEEEVEIGTMPDSPEEESDESMDDSKMEMLMNMYKKMKGK